MRIDEAPGPPYRKAVRAIMNTMLELFAAHRNTFDTHAARSAHASRGDHSHCSRLHPHARRTTVARERMP
ncbi:hypothetical protein [Burkholderia sp. GS2Y]|uniref:Uncharacterized protein n=1 Tax=Burkholderia theae TaxID=3143496 RepID=A0ABU9WN48_9BURK